VDKNLKSLSALGKPTALILQIGPFKITERMDVALASLATRRGQGTEFKNRAQLAGVPLPPPATSERNDPFGAFWVTPEMWFIEAPLPMFEDIAAKLKAAFGDTASITEQTDAWVRFDLSAPNPSHLLERLSNIDVDRVPDGHASRTVIDHVGCYLVRRNANEVTLYGPRSSANSLLHAITVAAESLL
jgi:sarcosine oxidase subunit gamma